MGYTREMDRETVVITGGAGFVGRYLIEELRREEPRYSLVVWDRDISRIPEGVKAALVDITEPSSYRHHLKTLRPAWIVHLAAVTSVPASLRDPDLTRRVNVEATRGLLEAVERFSPATNVLVASTATMYDQGSAVPLLELPLAGMHPSDPYAQSKWEMERMIEEHFSKRVLRVRPFPHIGPGQSLGFVTADFSSQIAAIEARKQEPVIRVGNLEAQRDFTDVRDVVRAYRLLMGSGVFGEACPAAERERGICGVYHVASGKAVSIRSVLDMLLSFSPVAVEVHEDPQRMRMMDILVLVGDARRLREVTGWQPQIPLECSLKDILTWWREHVRVSFPAGVVNASKA